MGLQGCVFLSHQIGTFGPLPNTEEGVLGLFWPIDAHSLCRGNFPTLGTLGAQRTSSQNLRFSWGCPQHLGPILVSGKGHAQLGFSKGILGCLRLHPAMEPGASLAIPKPLGSWPVSQRAFTSQADLWPCSSSSSRKCREFPSHDGTSSAPLPCTLG